MLLKSFLRLELDVAALAVRVHLALLLRASCGRLVVDVLGQLVQMQAGLAHERDAAQRAQVLAAVRAQVRVVRRRVPKFFPTMLTFPYYTIVIIFMEYCR